MGGDDPVTYLERSPAIAVGTGLTLDGGSSYAGQYLDFAVDSAAATETLSLATDTEPVTTAGAVSIVGSSVYLGNGTSADPIGSVDSVRDGTDGQPLRVNFTSAFTNPSFESADVTGWTTMNQRIDLGVTSIAGCVPEDTSTYPGPVTNRDNNTPSSLGTLTSAVQSTEKSDGTHALRMESSGMTTLAGYDVVHGPAVYSSPFEAAAGDKIYFDWRAFMGEDNFHVFGYIVDDDCNQIEVLDATGTTTPWTTKDTVIPASGTYRFVFVSGTFDATGGKAAGASLYIDNVRVFGTKVTDDVAQQMARRLMYANTSKNPPAARTITVTAQSSAEGAGSGQVPLTITLVDDAPSLGAVTPVKLTNTFAAQTFPTSTGTLVASDPEDDPITFGVIGGVAEDVTVNGVNYTHHLAGTYGTVYVNAATGAYAFVPAAAVDTRTTGDVETFSLTASSQALSDSQPLTVTVEVPDSEPGPPENLKAAPGNGQLTLTWTDSWWSGGSATTGYRVELSTDGGTSWTDAVADTGSTVKSYLLTGLNNGIPVTTRVSAINASGTSVPSAEVVATPRAVSVAPAVPGGAVATGSDTSVGPDDSARATAGPLTGTAAGTGAIAVSQLSDVPTPATAPGAASLDYFQVSTSPGSAFTEVELRVMSPTASSLFWFDGTTWRKVTGTTRDASTGAIVATLTGSTSPNVSQLSTLLLATGSTPAVRLGGLDRQQTAVAVSKDAYPAKGSAKVAVLATNHAFADALAGGPLAAAKDGPLLLTHRTSLPTVIAAELTRVLPKGATVYILGGTGAISPNVTNAVTALGFRVVRVGGSDRFATAVKVAGVLGNPTTVFLANGLDFPDAMSAGPAAVTSGGAVLLTRGTAQASATRAYLDGRATTRYAVGGQAATADASATRLVGSDRFETSALVAARFFPNPQRAGVAVGTTFPDALVAAPYLGRGGDPLLLARSTAALPGHVAEYLTAHSTGIGQVTVFGGTGSVSDALLRSVQRALP